MEFRGDPTEFPRLLERERGSLCHRLQWSWIQEMFYSTQCGVGIICETKQIPVPIWWPRGFSQWDKALTTPALPFLGTSNVGILETSFMGDVDFFRVLQGMKCSVLCNFCAALHSEFDCRPMPQTHIWNFRIAPDNSKNAYLYAENASIICWKGIGLWTVGATNSSRLVEENCRRPRSHRHYTDCVKWSVLWKRSALWKMVQHPSAFATVFKTWHSDTISIRVFPQPPSKIDFQTPFNQSH